MSEREEAVTEVYIQVATAHGSALTPSIFVTVHMWITWAELAIEHAHTAIGARQNMLDMNSRREDFSAEMGRETAESLLAICSSAFAMDALVASWVRLVMDSPTVAKWENPMSKIGIVNQTGQVLRRCCKDVKTAAELTDRWRTVFAQRGGAVHFLETSGPTVPHPSGITNAAEIHTTYSQESAVAAVDLLIDTLNEVELASKPKMKSWLRDMAGTLDALRARRI